MSEVGGVAEVEVRSGRWCLTAQEMGCGPEPDVPPRADLDIEVNCAEAKDCMSKANIFSWSEVARPDAASCES